MAGVKVAVTVETKNTEQVVALCLEQSRLIKDLHERVQSTVLDKRVKEMVESIHALGLDSIIKNIEREAFGAGFDYCEQWTNRDGAVISQEEVTVRFNEWLDDRNELKKCVICNGSGFNDDIFNETGHETNCVVCSGRGVK